MAKIIDFKSRQVIVDLPTIQTPRQGDKQDSNPIGPNFEMPRIVPLTVEGWIKAIESTSEAWNHFLNRISKRSA